MSKNAIRKYCSAFASKRKEKLRMETWNHLVGQKCFFYLSHKAAPIVVEKPLTNARCRMHNFGCAWFFYKNYQELTTNYQNRWKQFSVSGEGRGSS